jgi:Protein of unknown function (DUF3617)
MNTNHPKTLLLIVVLACVALPVAATDRIRAGQWVGTTTMPGRTVPTSTCMSQSDADAMNGDAESVRAYLEKVIPPTICKLTNIKVNGGQIVYTSACGGAAESVITTSYHGGSFEGTGTNGTKTEGKWVGACK